MGLFGLNRVNVPLQFKGRVVLEAVFGDDADVLRDVNFQVLLLANILGPLGSALVSPLLDSLIDPFGASEATIGLMLSAFTAPAIVMIPVAGVLMDRYGRRPVLLVSLPLFGLAGAAIGITTDYRIVLGLRVLQGIGFAGLNPVIITSIGDLYEGGQEATAQGFRFMGSGLAQTIFPILAGILVVIAWQYPFAIYLIALPAALAVYWWLDEPMATTSDQEHVVADGSGRMGSQLHDLLRLAAQPRVAAMIIARGMPVVAWIGFLTYNSILVVRILDGTPTDAGILAAVGALAYATSASQAGRVTALFPRRFPLLVFANLGLAGGVASVAFAPSLLVAIGGIGLAGVGFGITMSLYRSIITGLAPPVLRGGIVGFAESFGRVTGTLTPIVMGAAIGLGSATLGFEFAFRASLLGVGLAAGGIGILCLVVANAAPEPVSHA